MAGILRRFTKFIFGEGEEEELNALINKVEQYKCVHTRLYCFHTESATKMSIYTKAKASLVWNDSTGKFFVCLENLCDDDDEDEDEENQIFLPLIKDLNWNLDESKNDDDDFAIKHFFDYTKQKDLKNVGGGRYEVNFTTDAKTDEIENFENYINDILDFVEKITPAEEAKESTQADEEEKKEFSDSLFEGKGTLFQYNNEEDKNEVVEENVKFLVQKLEGDFKYAFTVIVEDVGEILIQTHVHEGTQASINSSSGVIMWIHDTFTSGDEDLNAFVFYFTNKGEKDIDILSKAVSKCIFECQRKVSIEDNVKEEDMSWMADAYVEDLREEEDKSEYNDEDEEYQGIDESYKDMIMEDDQEYDNKDFLQAHTYDRAFVVRGEGFGVYGTDNDSGLSYCGDIPILNEYSGAPAENLMLHDNENKLLFIDPQEKNLIKCYDFEKDKVVEEWEGEGVKKFNSFFGETKNSQSTPGSNIIACSDKGMYLMDPRVNTASKNVSQKVYSTNYLFSKITANMNGNIAVGSKNGEIRLYTKMGQTAKTMLPGIGQEITHLDVSQDGSWILATCKNYILVIPTKTKSGQTGFEKKMGKEKPKPKKLKLTQSDVVKYGLKKKEFTKATFNNGGNITESFITVSIGKFVVIWKLKKVKKGNLGDYDIKELHNSVVASESKYNTENEIMVALPKSLTVETRKKRK